MIIKVHPATGTIMIADIQSGSNTLAIWRSADGGQTFDGPFAVDTSKSSQSTPGNIPNPATQSQTIADMALDPDAGKKSTWILVTLTVSQGAFVYKTTDDGRTWFGTAAISSVNANTVSVVTGVGDGTTTSAVLAGRVAVKSTGTGTFQTGGGTTHGGLPQVVISVIWDGADLKQNVYHSSTGLITTETIDSAVEDASQ